MANKKVRRPRPTQAPAGFPEPQPMIEPPPIKRTVPRPAAPLAQSSRPGPKVSSTFKGRRSTTEELREEYAYVLQDLRRVFLLAMFILILLVALNLVL